MKSHEAALWKQTTKAAVRSLKSQSLCKERNLLYSRKHFGAHYFTQAYVFERKEKKCIENTSKSNLKRVQKTTSQSKYQKGDPDISAELSRLNVG